jgi:hypothetical protein
VVLEVRRAIFHGSSPARLGNTQARLGNWIR